MNYLNRLLAVIDNISSWVGKIVSFIIYGITVVILVTIAARAFDHPVNWTFEISYYLFGSYFLLAGSYALLHLQHVKVDVLYRRLPPRVGAVVNVFTWLFFFMFVGTMLWGGVSVALRSIDIQEKFSTLWAPPMYPLKIMIPLGALLIILQGVAHFIRDLTVAIGKSYKRENS